MKSNALRATALLGSLIFADAAFAQTNDSSFTQAIEAVRAQIKGNQYESAQKTAEQALALAQTPSNQIEALVTLGLTYSQRKLYDQAREQWSQVLQLPQASAQEKISAQYAIALSYSEQENWARARTELRPILANPEAATSSKVAARIGVATTYFGEKNEKDGRETLSVIAQDASLATNTRVTAYMQIASSFSREKKFDDARLALASAIDLPGVSPDLALFVQAAIAQSLQAKGDGVRAQEEFAKAQEMAVNRFVALKKAGQFSSARAALDLLLTLGKIAPLTQVTAKSEYGTLFLNEGKSAEARKVFEAILKKRYEGLTPTEEVTLLGAQQSAQLGIAKTYVQEQNKAQAEQVLKKLLASDKIQPNVQMAAQKLLQSLA